MGARAGDLELGAQARHLRIPVRPANEDRGRRIAGRYWIHLVFSNLKTWLNGIHHGVSAKHLQAYLNEFTFRFNRRFYPFNAFRSLLGIAGGVEATTYADLYSGAWRHPTCSGCLR